MANDTSCDHRHWASWRSWCDCCRVFELVVDRAGVSAFAQALRSLGVFRCEDVAELRDSDLLQVGLSLVQVRRLQRLAAEHDVDWLDVWFASSEAAGCGVAAAGPAVATLDAAGARSAAEAALLVTAAGGAVAQSSLCIPGFDDIKGTGTALGGGDSVLYGTAAVFVGSGVLEQIWKEQPGKEAGNFGDPVGLYQSIDEMRIKQINREALSQFSAPLRRSESIPDVSMVTSSGGSSAFWPADQLGAMAPLGHFDPVAFAEEGDEAGLKNQRAAELVFGGVAMMAAVGAFAQSTSCIPGFQDVKGTFTALGGGDSVLYGTATLFVGSGVLEQIWKQQPGKQAGNFGDPVGLYQSTDEMRVKEIDNGRMAMVIVLGIFGAELVTGRDALSQFSALPRRSERTPAAETVTENAKRMQWAEVGLDEPVEVWLDKVEADCVACGSGRKKKSKKKNKKVDAASGAGVGAACALAAARSRLCTATAAAEQFRALDVVHFGWCRVQLEAALAAALEGMREADADIRRLSSM
eukprot:TRINITY_DN15477_c0_g2_i1.p1 TRINITY_DN15477_c0_g2~~TRINITY_DN15477_c0_g2_i1.p1  ORF type:complete len:523 (-),score=138.76 TRINITY_DN15477_c0_g2_i1:483-2051(-)